MAELLKEELLHTTRKLYPLAAPFRFLRRLAQPTLVLLEDMDSLTKECRLTRSALLQHLDGLDGAEGQLVIGTTNNPGDIDPALIHRPSRFDRVWHINLPDRALRLRYLTIAFPDLADETLKEMADYTVDWSFAYLNELRATASIMALNQKATQITVDMVEAAFDVLEAQFRAGRKNHVQASVEGAFGFSQP